MEKIIFTGIILCTALWSCNRTESAKSIPSLEDSITAIINQRESVLNDFISSFNEIERNLDSVAVQQHIIYINADTSKGDFNPTQKERINATIRAINQLMHANRKKIITLSRELKKSANKKEFKELIVTLKGKLVQKDIEFTTLNEKLAALNIQVTLLQTSMNTLDTQCAFKLREMDEQSACLKDVLKTAYYIVGTTKDLQEAQLIDREGGFLGIGKISKLKGDFDTGKFIQIDYTQTDTIPVNGEDAKVITSHPSDSYTLEKDKTGTLTNLVITNPEKFWSISKYLVIVHN